MPMPAREQQHAIAAASEPLPKAEIRPAAIVLDGRFSSEEHLAFLTPQLSSGLRPEFHAAFAQTRFLLRACWSWKRVRCGRAPCVLLGSAYLREPRSQDSDCPHHEPRYLDIR